jgi:hypothetical protein
MPLPLWVLLLPVGPSGFAVHVSSLSLGRRIARAVYSPTVQESTYRSFLPNTLRRTKKLRFQFVGQWRAGAESFHGLK